MQIISSVNVSQEAHGCQICASEWDNLSTVQQIKKTIILTSKENIYGEDNYKGAIKWWREAALIHEYHIFLTDSWKQANPLYQTFSL